MRLTLKNISKTFGPLKANDSISYTFEPGMIYAILGENGAGKSTLMKIIAGYQPPDPDGSILIDEQPVAIAKPTDALRYGIGMLYQDPLDFPPMTVLENYMTARPDSKLLPDWKAARAQFTAITERFGFTIDPNMLIESLTIGARQQLEIVRLLSLNVKFLILDEPTTGISEEQRQKLFSTLRQLAAEDQMIIAIVTHKLEDVEVLCDAGFVLRHGKVTGTFQTPTPTSELVQMMFGQPQREAQSQETTHTLGAPVLVVKDLNITAQRQPIEQINLEVREGEIIGLAGLDGSGQVSFMRACAGLNRVTWRDHLMSGVALAALLVLFALVLGYSRTVFSVTMLILVGVTLGPFVAALLRYYFDPKEHIFFRGKPTKWLNYRDLRGMGLSYLSAGRLEEGLVAGLTLTQHFALISKGGSLFINWFKARQQTETGIRTYDIRGQASSPIQTLSGGNQQRVALALLPAELRLAFLDNPTRGLDVNSARNIWNLMLERRKTGTAIIFSSPDLDEIVEYSDRVVVFSSGRYTLVEDNIESHRLGMLIGGKHDA